MATWRNEAGDLFLGGVSLAEIAADPRIGTPSYVYDLDAIAAEARALDAAFEGAPHLVAYAVKANSAGPIVRALAAEGCGADVVSGGELAVALGCGVPASKIVFSGVAKSDAEIDQAIAADIHAIHVESIEEIGRIHARAASLSKKVRVAIRVNPAIDADALDTHAHIATGHDEAKFGVPRADIGVALTTLEQSRDWLALTGITSHIGSQFIATAAYVEAARTLFDIAREARERGAPITFVDTGGGFGIDYGDGCPVKPADFVRAVRDYQRASRQDDLALNVEPGRAFVAAHGVLLASVIQRKSERAAPHRSWIMIDAGMNDLIRPALYQARHRIVPLHQPASPTAKSRVVGPVCESSDDFGDHVLPSSLDAGARVALLDAGAYGFTMASRYNGRSLPAEAFLRAGRIVAVSPRTSVDAWVADRVGIAG